MIIELHHMEGYIWVFLLKVKDILKKRNTKQDKVLNVHFMRCKVLVLSSLLSVCMPCITHGIEITTSNVNQKWQCQN